MTAKLPVDDAGLYCVLPACVAWMVHVPTASSVAVFAETVQTGAVVEAKVTGRLDEAVALRLTDPADKMVAGIEAKLMV